jgi:D-xylose 1-dehydrogenase
MMTPNGAIYPSLKGKTVLVTGGGSGIGEAIVRRYADQGAKVGYLDFAKEPSEVLAATLKAAGQTVHFEFCDLRDIPAMRIAIDKVRVALGPITILVNNAARDDRHKLEDVTPEFFDERIATNLRHQLFASQAVLPDMKAAGGGSIIMMGSTSWYIGMGGMSVYTTAKSAVLGLTRSLARDFGPFNVRVNSIAPGWIMTQRQIDLWVTPESIAAALDKQCLKRRLMPDDVANVAVFLGADEASAMTNQDYVVDGGWV